MLSKCNRETVQLCGVTSVGMGKSVILQVAYSEYDFYMQIAWSRVIV